MQLMINKTLRSRVKRASRELGLPERELVQRAVATYLDDTDDIAALYRELRAWDVATAKTMQKYDF